MNLAGAARLARRLHRGEIDEAGGAYLDHLARDSPGQSFGDEPGFVKFKIFRW